MVYTRPIVVSIAGMDPTGGAGLLADVKTCEQHRCLGFGVVSALTVQTEDTFYRADWLPMAAIIDQAAPLFAQYEVAVVKIGIVENFAVLDSLVRWITEQRPGIRIVWDPVLTASAGFRFVDRVDPAVLQQVLQHIYLITPNAPEARQLAGVDNTQEAARHLASDCRVYLKGGHLAENTGTDYLYEAETVTTFSPGIRRVWPKHGSGCILSSAIASRLAEGKTLAQACVGAKEYIERILISNENLLAYHHV
ncbi:hydroxymethylpyrimidine/phosphomethylpyrimidine kinase [Fulvivirgaceae bacterium PWU5]|uniref:hydroxymethylpyrimidine kinase n=1 Tax=Dawidia cretensis TaxID=2782350 RepID=A0AAP2E135_9BACT|nr:hydroxymethylpyrimidine/phosphomethylpyrimidine kinase [Dawidia cretensis]MBT1710815.1 hydroxymethylpyrimidine/phosphomethylpyrimidine kinase [Dawidia cretensis]